MSKKKSRLPASTQTAAQRSKAAPRSPASRSSARWVWGGLGLLAVIIVAALILQGAGAVARTPVAGTPVASTPPVSAPAAGLAKASLPAEISVAEAAAKRDAGAFILDVREPDEWNEYHIPGATLISLGELEARVQEVPRDKEVVVVCRSGNRSKPGRDILVKAGFTNVTSMAGGLKEWAAAKLPTVSGP